jgi:hypothetical protein
MAKSMLLSRYQGDAIVVIFSAYFDASGHPRQHDVLTVAGYAAAVDSWIRFDVAWKEALATENATAFHTTEFTSGQGQFKHFKEKTPEITQRRRVFVEGLMSCIQKHCAKFFRASVFIPDYEKVNDEYPLSELVGCPYALCCSLVTLSLRAWANDLGALDTLLYFFEDGDKGKGDWERIHKNVYGKNPRFLDKSEAIAFEAADFNAWKLRTALHEANKPDHTPEKGAELLRSISILENIRRDAGVLNERSLRAFCEQQKVMKR